MTERSEETRRFVAAAGVTVVAVVVAMSLHIRDYFFLFDDFALVQTSLQTSLADMWRTPLYNFYRPLAFLFTAPQAAVAGWHWPWLYALASCSVHGVNAWLVGRLAHRLAVTPGAALLSSAVFFCSPWAGEAYFWVSGRFDLLATTGVLFALLWGLRAAQEASTRRRLLFGAASLTAAAAAVLAKEAAVLLPAFGLIVFAIARVQGQRVPGTAASLSVVFGTTIVVAAYLWWREQLLPGLQGMYGGLGDLYSQGTLGHTALVFVVRTLSPPLPVTGSSLIGWAGIAGYVAAMGWLLGHLLVSRVRVAVLLGLGFAVALLPVLWFPIDLHGSGKSRLLYQSGIWVSLGLGLAMRDGLASVVRPGVRARLLQIATAAALVGITVNVWAQAGIWRAASATSRGVVTDIAAQSSPGKQVFLPMLPSVFESGVPVIEAYGISAYLGTGAPPVRTRHAKVRVTPDRLQFVEWLEPQRGSPLASTDETTIILSTGVSGAPTGRLDLQGGVTSPAAGGIVDRAFVVEGWAHDRGFGTGAGVDTVHVWAHPRGSTPGAPVFLGAATMNGAGFQLRIAGLAPGQYELTAHPHLMATGEFGPAFVVPVVVRP